MEISEKKIRQYIRTQVFPVGASGTEFTCQCRRLKRLGFDSWVRKIPEGGSADNSNILAWEIPWTEETSRLQSMELQKMSDMTGCTLTKLRVQETLTLKKNRYNVLGLIKTNNSVFQKILLIKSKEKPCTMVI